MWTRGPYLVDSGQDCLGHLLTPVQVMNPSPADVRLHYWDQAVPLTNSRINGHSPAIIQMYRTTVRIIWNNKWKTLPDFSCDFALRNDPLFINGLDTNFTIFLSEGQCIDLAPSSMAVTEGMSCPMLMTILHLANWHPSLLYSLHLSSSPARPWVNSSVSDDCMCLHYLS